MLPALSWPVSSIMEIIIEKAFLRPLRGEARRPQSEGSLTREGPPSNLFGNSQHSIDLAIFDYRAVR